MFREIRYALIAVFIIALVFAALAVYIRHRTNECYDQGGVLVRGAWYGWECVDGRP